MPPKSVKAALARALADLSAANLKAFIHDLLDRQEEPRVTRNRVEGKDHLDIVDVLVSTFTEEPAVQVTLDILRDIECRDVADELAKHAAGLLPKAANRKPQKPDAGGPSADMNEHFVDKHQAELIQRINSIDPILDRLMTKDKVIQQEAYDLIRSQPTRQEKVRKLYPYLGTRKAKDAFYSHLLDLEKFLVEDLNESQ